MSWFLARPSFPEDGDRFAAVTGRAVRREAASVEQGPGTGLSVSLKTEATSAGTVLADGQGWTLYYFAEDKPGGPSGMPLMLELRARTGFCRA